MVRHAIWVGMREGLWVALPTAVGFLALGWEWAVGLGWGFAAVGAGRLARWGFVMAMLRDGRGGAAAGLSGLARHLFLALFAVGGVVAGLPPLAVAAGLVVPTVGRWIWTVKLARAPG